MQVGEGSNVMATGEPPLISTLRQCVSIQSIQSLVPPFVVNQAFNYADRFPVRHVAWQANPVGLVVHLSDPSLTVVEIVKIAKGLSWGCVCESFDWCVHEIAVMLAFRDLLVPGRLSFTDSESRLLTVLLNQPNLTVPERARSQLLLSCQLPWPQLD